MIQSHLPLYPLTFEPVFRSYIWGGRHLEALGRALPEGIVAESWEISGHASAPTQVDAGPLAGRPLTELVDELGPALIGRRSAPGRFPLLVKLLDANQPLSVQVHPDDAYARQHENGELGKSEMWYLLRAEPGARLIYGLCAGVTPAAFRAALAAGALERCLHYLPVQAGDAILVRAGSLHALLEGAVVAEIQQNSDATYRVYDWNRLGADGKPRPLHVEKAMDVIDFGLMEPGPFVPQVVESRPGLRREVISQCDKFTVEKVWLDAGARLAGACIGETFEIWGCMDGDCRVEWGGAPVALPGIRFALLPAALGKFEIVAARPATLLRAWV